MKGTDLSTSTIHFTWWEGLSATVYSTPLSVSMALLHLWGQDSHIQYNTMSAERGRVWPASLDHIDSIAHNH